MTERSEVAATVENLPSVLATLLAPVANETLATRPSPDEWSINEIIGHLITSDGPAFRDRIAAIVNGAEDIASFEPNGPVAARNFNEASFDTLLRELHDERTRSAAFIRSLSDADVACTAAYGRHGRLAADDFVHEWPFHDHDHLQQILDVLKQAHVAAMSEEMRAALEAQ